MSCILVVEDDNTLRFMLKEILEDEGYDVMVAGDGVAALELMEEKCPDLILSDIMMPRMDGYDFYEAVRGNVTWIPIPFIFLTARAEREDVRFGKALGAEDYLVKPFEAEDLFIAIQARLARAQAIQGASDVKFDQLKRQIITVLGHELRTPLTYITGYTSLALDDLPELAPEQFRNFLKGIQVGSDRLGRLVEDFLLVFDIDSGSVARNFAGRASICEDLGAAIRRAVSLYEPEAAQEDLVLAICLPPSFPPVLLHESHFSNALGRLLSNAIKFSKRPGQERKIEIEGQVEDSWVSISVIDHGIGISETQSALLFNRFLQLNRERMEQQGLGLGLHIAQKLIQLHGGSIEVASELGVGSTFTIRLPVFAVETS